MPDIPLEAVENTEVQTPRAAGRRISEAVCIDTARVYDSCADKDCLSNLCVYFTETDQPAVDAASVIRCRGCEVLNVFSEIEKVPFNTGYYSVDNTFFFRVALDLYTGPNTQPQTVYGLSSHAKKSILYGSEGSVKVFSSEYAAGTPDLQFPAAATNPRAKIQVATPICLDARFSLRGDCIESITDPDAGIPEAVRQAFNGPFVIPPEDRAVRVTVGLFSIVQLERDVQILIPAYDYCMPEKACTGRAEDPCEAFSRIGFPVNEFFPPEQTEEPGDGGGSLPDCGCGK